MNPTYFRNRFLVAMLATIAAAGLFSQSALGQQYKTLKDSKDALLRAQDSCQQSLANIRASEQATKDRLVRLQNTEDKLERRLDAISRQLKNVDCARTDLHR